MPDPSLPSIAPKISFTTINQPRARTSARTFDQLTALDHMGVRVVDGNIKAKGLEQNILVAHQLLGLQ